MKYFIYKYCQNDTVVYIGQSTDLKARIEAHKYDQLKDFNGTIYYTEVTSKQEMDLIELILINQYHPVFNTSGKIKTIDVILKNNLFWKKYNPEDFKEDLTQQQIHERYLKQKNYTYDKKNPQGKPRKIVDENLFISINKQYENNEITIEKALKELNISRTSFYKIRRFPEGYFGKKIDIKPKLKRKK